MAWKKNSPDAGQSLRQARGAAGGTARHHVRMPGLQGAGSAIRLAAPKSCGAAVVVEGCRAIDRGGRPDFRTVQGPAHEGQDRRAGRDRGEYAVAANMGAK